MYCIDTSSLIQLADYYPIDVFPTLWTNMDNLVYSGRLFAPSSVFEELKKKDDAIAAWIKNRQNMIIEIDESIQVQVTYILSNYKDLVDLETGKSMADPFVIATAKAQAPFLTVITEENPRSPKKIPYICTQENIKCINLLGLMREQSWGI